MSDPRAGTGIYKMNLEHLMVLECKEMLRKTRQSISLFSMSVSPLLFRALGRIIVSKYGTDILKMTALVAAD